MRKVRTLPQETPETKFTRADLRILGELSVTLGRLHWQNEVGGYENQVCILLAAQERLAQLISDALMREL